MKLTRKIYASRWEASLDFLIGLALGLGINLVMLFWLDPDDTGFVISILRFAPLVVNVPLMFFYAAFRQVIALGMLVTIALFFSSRFAMHSLHWLSVFHRS